MNSTRKERYRKKIEIIIDRMDLPDKPKNELERRGILYSIQTSIEAMVDICAMLVKDLGVTVKDDKTNFKIIAKRKKLDQKLVEDLQKANGMRNFIVHYYGDLDEKIIFDSIEDLKKLLFTWLKVVEELLDELD